MRDLHKTRQTNITMFGKPVNIKDFKYVRMGQGSEGETVSSSREPESEQSARKHNKWVSHNDPQKSDKDKSQTSMTMYSSPYADTTCLSSSLPSNPSSRAT